MISVIIPVYNVEDYISSCLDSILSQSYTDFEVLLIDDGSTDGSGDICDSYSAKDNRIKVFHIKNTGVSNARNIGIENAQGEWLTFIDSDDLLLDGTFKNWQEIIEKKDIKLIVSGIKFNNDLSGHSVTFQQLVDKTVFSDNSEEFIIHLLDYLKLSVWGKVYHKSLFSDIRFSIGIPNYEDVIALWEIANKRPSYVLSSHIGYEARFRSQSASRTHGGVIIFEQRMNSLIYGCKRIGELFGESKNVRKNLSRFMIVEGLGCRQLYQGIEYSDRESVSKLSAELYQIMISNSLLPSYIRFFLYMRIKTIKYNPNRYPGILYYPIHALIRLI